MADHRESRLRRGIDALKRVGISAEDASIEQLEGALGSDPDTALAVAELCGALRSVESATLLARIEREARGDKLLRREARRSLYRLKQKGIEPNPQAGAEAPGPRPALGGPDVEGLLSFGDAAGDRLAWILKPRPGGGLLHLSTVVNEPAGLKEAVLAEVNSQEHSGAARRAPHAPRAPPGRGRLALLRLDQRGGIRARASARRGVRIRRTLPSAPPAALRVRRRSRSPLFCVLPPQTPPRNWRAPRPSTRNPSCNIGFSPRRSSAHTSRATGRSATARSCSTAPPSSRASSRSCRTRSASSSLARERRAGDGVSTRPPLFFDATGRPTAAQRAACGRRRARPAEHRTWHPVLRRARAPVVRRLFRPRGRARARREGGLGARHAGRHSRRAGARPQPHTRPMSPIRS